MARALSGLPSELIASEREVGVAIQESMRSTLKGRRQKLSLLERLSAVVSDADESTQFFGATGVGEASQRGTLPPKDSGDSSEIITARPPAPDGAPKVPRLGPTDDEDETRVFRAKEVQKEPARTVEIAPDHEAEAAPKKKKEEHTERARSAPRRSARNRAQVDAQSLHRLDHPDRRDEHRGGALRGSARPSTSAWLRVPGARSHSSAQASSAAP